MSDLDHIIPFSTENGNDYLIKFSKFNNFDHIGIPIVDISLIATNQDIALNSLKSLLHISSIIRNYLLEHNVILYYYCDRKDINRRNLEISPQQFRNMLFDTLFRRCNSDNFICRQLVIEDNEQGNHYISFITHQNNEMYFDLVSKEINNLK